MIHFTAICKDQQESRAVAEKPHDAVVTFDIFILYASLFVKWQQNKNG